MDIIKHDDKAVYPIIYETAYDGLGSVNCYLLRQGDTFTLIDAGLNTPEYKAFFLETLAKYHIELKQIKSIILTHFHSDHTGLVKWLVKELDIPVHASCLAVPRIAHDEMYLNNKVTIYEELYKQYGILQYAETRMNKLRQTYEKRHELRLDFNLMSLKEGDKVAGLLVLSTPGHSPDSISFYDVETGWLFGGDVLFENGLASALLEYDERESIRAAYVDYFATLVALKQKQISMIFPGHRNPFSNYEEIIERAMNKVEYKIEKVLKHIRAGRHTVEQLGITIYGPRFAQLFTFTVSDIVALLQLGEARGLIEKRIVDGIFTFHIKN